MDLGLRDKIVLITGASGGIGEAAAKLFASEGAKLILHYGKSREAVEKLQKELPTTSIAVSADMTNRENVDNLFAQAVGKFGRVDIVVANAGIFPPDDVPIDQMDEDRFDKVVATNLKGPWLTARAFFRTLRIAPVKRPSLIIVSSTSGIFGEAGHSEYSAVKSALLGLNKTLKNEMSRVAPGGNVNVVAPGWTWTGMTERFHHDTAAITTAMQTRSITRVGRPEDIANAIVFFASDRAAYIAGQVLGVDGGMEGRLLWRPEEIDPSKA